MFEFTVTYHLSRGRRRRTSAAVSADLFDMKLRAMRRDRAAIMGPELFLLERAFDDCLDRLDMVQRRFGSALLLGCPDREWPSRLRQRCDEVEVIDPGARYAKAAGGRQAEEGGLPVAPGSYDLILTVGVLDTVNVLPDILLRLGLALRPDGLFLGAIAGRDTLPRLRAAMRAADEVAGVAAPHVHPRIDPPALAGLLSAAGFDMAVIDVDRVAVSYRSLLKLVKDLRGMAATNVLTNRPRTPLSRRALESAERTFAQSGSGGRTVEMFEILHFAAWTPAN